ncbi:unnamed protein product [Rotaria sordida]|uniref:Protein kinase domain-containing protein n=1 Tax=Rotaria sordida TaxID=392033 RepID=A0A814WC23_9BILA|nr:unnamed protein product [Rotaria sordida]CAF1471720.1 unnamed protein product [Rotaria sordida]
MEQHERIELLDAIKLTQKLLSTVKEIHDRGIVHRDIKPGNLLVVHDPNAPIERAEIHVIDFGLAYSNKHEDTVDWSSFEEKEKYRQTYFGHTMGNSFYRVPQLNSPTWKNKTQKEQNVLLHIRRSPTIDASSVCTILFWMLTGIEPGTKHRNDSNLAPHQTEEADTCIMMKINEAVKRIGIANELSSALTKQLRNYIMTTFDKGFENAEYQWTVEQLEYRLHSICHILEHENISLDLQFNNAAKISCAFEFAKAIFIEKHPSCSWYDGYCHWLEYRQDMTERKNYDLLTYRQNKQSWMLIIVCSLHFNENGDIITLTIGSDFNRVYVELPLGQYAPDDLNNLNIQVEFERELINLLQAICEPKYSTIAQSPSSTN